MNAIIRGPIELSIEQELLQSGLNAEQVEGAKVTTDALAQAKSDYHEAAAHIGSDTLLNDEGKKVHLAQLRENQASHYHKIADERLAGLDKRLAELGYQVRPQAPDGDATRELMLMQEVRSMVADWDELHLIEEYQGLAVSGANDLWMRSVEQSPVPLISDPAILEAGRAARGLRQSPEAATTLRQLRTVRATIQSTLDAALFEVNAPDRTLEDAAAGTAA